MKRVAICGLGGMGMTHYRVYQDMPNVTIVAVADPRTEMAKEKIAKDAVKVYSDLQTLLKNEIVDIVDVCAPSYLHPELSIMAMEAGKDVLCEKPMAIDSKGTAKIMSAIERTGRSFMVAHVVRFMSAYRYLKKVVDDGELGKPVHFSMKRVSSIPDWNWENWMQDKSKSGGALIDLSVHDIDYIQYVFGEPVNISGAHHEYRDQTEYHCSDLVYENGFTASITGGWYKAKIPFRASYLAVFEKGYVSFEGGKCVKNGEAVNFADINTEKDTGVNVKGFDGYSDEIIYFVECLEKGISPDMVTPVSSENAIKLVERIIEEDITL